jgi:hypothetical protein
LSVDAVTAHPNKCGIAVIRITFVNFGLVVSGANPITVGDHGLFVRAEFVGEVFPEPVLPLGLHAIPGV